MKSRIFYAIAGLTVAGAMVSSCADSYLDTAPLTTVSTDDVIKTVDAAQLALNGICEAMQTQYQGTSYNQLNGESYFNTIYNEALGQDDLTGLGLSMWGSEIVTGGAPWQKDNYVLNALPWQYCYNLITQANTIIAGIDDAEGDEEHRNYVKASALTLRAHGYTKLMQYYAPRWEDSRNGEAMCAVLRVEPGIADVPLCTMNQVFELIYSDLTTAVELFENSTWDRDYKWQPNLNVAYGVFARAAMIIHDFPKAQEMAKKAQTGYKVMDNKTFLSGFVYDNDDFMWIQSSDPADIYYWSWGCHHAVNGIYVNNWGEGAGAIDYDLYKQMDEKDIRRQCFLTPDKVAVLQAVNRAWNPGLVKDIDWWNPGLVIESSNCDLSSGPYAKKDAVTNEYGKDRWGLYNIAIRYCKYYGDEIFTGNFKDMDNEGFKAYYTEGPKGAVLLKAGVYGKLAKIPFGAQFKFWSIPPYGVSAYPFMRCTEMVLTEAEAACHNHDYTTARKCLNSINSMRIPGYSAPGDDADLLEEVILSRRIELWGEGFSWPDFKRWNRDIIRRAWVPGDVNSGNWMIDYSINTPASINNGWRMLVPRGEYQYNDAINRNELEF